MATLLYVRAMSEFEADSIPASLCAQHVLPTLRHCQSRKPIILRPRLSRPCLVIDHASLSSLFSDAVPDLTLLTRAGPSFILAEPACL